MVHILTEIMDISILLKAAEYLARREKEAEHCYALTAPAPVVTRSCRQRSSKAKIARSSHNELEKNRRAHLRQCFEELKRVVPFSDDASRHTTLGLLKQARLFIEAAQERHRQSVRCLRQLIRERQQLLRHQKILAAGGGELSFRGSHTISESSVSSSSSSGSSAFSEREDLDVLGSGTSGPSEDEEASDANDGEAGSLDYSIAFTLRL